MSNDPTPPPIPPVKTVTPVHPVSPPPAQKSKFPLGCVISAVVAFVLIFVIGILAALAMPAYNRIAERAKMANASNDCKQLILGCRMYAADHEGVFPPDLETLYPDYIDVPDLFVAVDKRGEKFPVVYHAGLTDSAPADDILIEYPLEFHGQRIVGRIGGMVQAVPTTP